MNTYKVIGLMSGTSLDGLDIAFCVFTEKNDKWSFQIKNAETIPYTKQWKEKLSSVENKTAFDFALLNSEYGHYLGLQTKIFIKKNKLKVDFIASHGHTVFHQPDKKVTFQIGSGATIAAECKLPVVCDFRSLDVALGGQGAPLVPIGDKLLFSEYDYCLNLGGFANISFTSPRPVGHPSPVGEGKGVRFAFDICPVNIIINELCKKTGKEFDDKGLIARKGKVNQLLLNELNKLKFYHQKKNQPKSLGKEWVIKYFNPILNKHRLSVEDKLRTVYEHIAEQITYSTFNTQRSTILITGGGAYNDFLVERIKALTNHKIIIPEKNIIEFKEALIFAFLGVLRMRNEVNCLKSVTGAFEDNVGGAVSWNN